MKKLNESHAQITVQSFEVWVVSLNSNRPPGSTTVHGSNLLIKVFES